MKVHVTLKSEACADAEVKQKALDAVRSIAGIASYNMRRFERYGIISGEAAQPDLERLRGLQAVEAVEVDEEKHALRR
jgi:hypothetical protein